MTAEENLTVLNLLLHEIQRSLYLCVIFSYDSGNWLQHTQYLIFNYRSRCRSDFMSNLQIGYFKKDSIIFKRYLKSVKEKIKKFKSEIETESISGSTSYKICQDDSINNQK